LERAVAEAVVEEQPERDAVACVVLSATMARIWSVVNVVRKTARFLARSIASVGSPRSFPRSTWNLKKSLRIERFLL